MATRRKRSPIWRMPTEELRSIVGNATTLSEVVRVFGLEPKGGNIATLRRRLTEESIDFGHISQRATRPKQGFGKSSPPLAEVLVENSTYSRRSLKRRLLKTGMLREQCVLCEVGPVWRGQKLVLVLDHENGDATDNRLANLRLLCPNCHSQTPTFAARNKTRVVYRCDCGRPRHKTSQRCKDCYAIHRPTAIEWPEDDKLLAMVEATNRNTVARQLGVAYNSLTKRLQRIK